MTGNFIWYELMTTDVAAAADFYGKVLGWNVKNEGGNDAQGNAYHHIYSRAGEGVGGMMKRPMEQAPVAWNGYIHVEDLDAACTAIEGDGGKKWMEHEVPNAGRFAIVNDPQQASFYVMQPSPADPNAKSRDYEPGTPGHVGWHEYHGKDGEAALAFYTKHFGWTHDDDFDMGPMGKYHLFAIDGERAGGIMSDSNFPHPAWLFYFSVEDIGAA
ncbi:MAG: VOC family protein, partial [Alphaproteobacteria bacterium]|nr:VOC family protein [Alphaproteobacteria bacterium]